MLGWSVFSEGPTNGCHNLHLRTATSSWAGLEYQGAVCGRQHLGGRGRLSLFEFKDSQSYIETVSKQNNCLLEPFYFLDFENALLVLS